jgi:hypothetical protein
MRIRDILKEAITVHHQLGDSELDRRMSYLLENVILKKASSPIFHISFPAGRSAGLGLRVPWQ